MERRGFLGRFFGGLTVIAGLAKAKYLTAGVHERTELEQMAYRAADRIADLCKPVAPVSLKGTLGLTKDMVHRYVEFRSFPELDQTEIAADTLAEGIKYWKVRRFASFPRFEGMTGSKPGVEIVVVRNRGVEVRASKQYDHLADEWHHRLEVVGLKA
jgi:hypothetical protein